MNMCEAWFLQMLDWECFISQELYTQYTEQMHQHVRNIMRI